MACEPVEIWQGDSKTIIIELFEDDCSTSAYNLTGATEIKVRFPATAGGYVEKTLGGGDVIVLTAYPAKISVALDGTDTALLLAGSKQTYYGIATFPSGNTTFEMLKQLTVLVHPF
jgi:hypothetical protein